jgi:hypothetical protein
MPSATLRTPEAGPNKASRRIDHSSSARITSCGGNQAVACEGGQFGFDVRGGKQPAADAGDHA